MKTNSYYFSHDYNASNDTKILFLRHQLGMEGYGIYWFLIERLADAGGKLPIELIPVLAMQMQSTDVKVKGVITKFDLFIIQSGQFWSERLQEHLGLREKLSQSGKNGALNRWKNGGPNGVAIGEANAKEIKEKESKLKENKIKENKVKEIIYPFESDEFKKYWSLWVDFKKEQFNFTYKSSISLQAALNELTKLAEGREDLAIKIIMQSINNSWKGLFKLKTENNGNTNYSKQAAKVTDQQLHEAFAKRNREWQ